MSKMDLYNKLKQMRVEYKKNPSPDLEAYIEKLVKDLKQTVSSYKVFSRIYETTAYFTLKNIDSQRSEGKFDTYEEAKRYAEEKNIDLSDEDSPYFIDEIKESKIEPKKSEPKKKEISDEDREKAKKLREEKRYWREKMYTQDSDNKWTCVNKIRAINKQLNQLGFKK